MNYNREYRSSIFAMLFNDKKELLSLYNAVNGTAYTDEEEITVNTLENEGVPSGIFMKMNNDLSFIFRSYLNLYEHQSTVSGNLSLRLLLYVSDILYNIVPKRKLYSSRAVKLPSPRFVVFYNGKTFMPERQIIRLSDLYEIEDDKPDLELRAVVYNINKGMNGELLEKCRTLSDYTEFVTRMQIVFSQKLSEGELLASIEAVIDQCIQDDVLKIFLQKHREAVIMYSRLAYDEEAHEAAIREDSFEDGIQQGIQQGIKQGMEQGIQQGIKQGMEQGIEQGRNQGIKVFIEDKLEDNVSVDIIREKLIRRFALEPEEAEKYLQN